MAYSRAMILRAKELYFITDENGDQEHSLNEISKILTHEFPKEIPKSKKNPKAKLDHKTVSGWARKYLWTDDLKINREEMRRKASAKALARQKEEIQREDETRQKAMGESYLTHQLGKRKNDEIHSLVCELLVERLSNDAKMMSNGELIKLYQITGNIDTEHTKMVNDAVHQSSMKIKVNLNIIPKTDKEKVIDVDPDNESN